MENQSVFDNENIEAASTRPKKITRRGVQSEINDWIESILVWIAAALVVMTFVIRVSDVIGESMENTLQNGNKLLVWQLGYTPQRGDVVIIQANNITNKLTGEKGEPIVKRVIGIAGDVIDINENGEVVRNGEVLKEDYIKELIKQYRRGNAEFPVTVEENTVFVMGDNRNNSLDSRYVKNGSTVLTEYVGCVENEYVIGKVILRFFPFDKISFIK